MMDKPYSNNIFKINQEVEIDDMIGIITRIYREDDKKTYQIIVPTLNGTLQYDISEDMMKQMCVKVKEDD